MYWSLRRELWENRSLYLAPVIVAAVVLFATAISTIGLPSRMRAMARKPPAQRTSIVKAYDIAPAPIMLTTFIVAIFYCIDALNGERRDRSILFWKSMPVSDRTTVLAKVLIPLVVLPLIAFVLSLITQVALLLLSTAILLANGMSPVPLWTQMQFFQGVIVMVYGLTVHALWFAPIYGWLLLVSAWARRAPILWALLPLLAISAVERITFNTWLFMNMLQYRVTGAMFEAFAFTPKGSSGDVTRLSQLTPVRFLSASGLWAGLLLTVLFLIAAVRLRHKREPI